jgi:hypothetical protein
MPTKKKLLTKFSIKMARKIIISLWLRKIFILFKIIRLQLSFTIPKEDANGRAKTVFYDSRGTCQTVFYDSRRTCQTVFYDSRRTCQRQTWSPLFSLISVQWESSSSPLLFNPLNIKKNNHYTTELIKKINHGSQNVFWVLTWIGGY